VVLGGSRRGRSGLRRAEGRRSSRSSVQQCSPNRSSVDRGGVGSGHERLMRDQGGVGSGLHNPKCVHVGSLLRSNLGVHESLVLRPQGCGAERGGGYRDNVVHANRGGRCGSWRGVSLANRRLAVQNSRHHNERDDDEGEGEQASREASRISPQDSTLRMELGL
jgi:hypothetical protein